MPGHTYCGRPERRRATTNSGEGRWMALTWLHILDFHIKTGDPYDRDVVLRALVRAVERYRTEDSRQADLIFATGDIAHGGQAGEYEQASSFFDALLAAAGVTKERLFVIPGNHDVD